MDLEREYEELYRQYAEVGPIDNDEVWGKYQALRACVAHLPQGLQVEILECAADLVNAHEKAAFLAALQRVWEVVPCED